MLSDEPAAVLFALKYLEVQLQAVKETSGCHIEYRYAVHWVDADADFVEDSDVDYSLFFPKRRIGCLSWVGGSLSRVTRLLTSKASVD